MRNGKPINRTRPKQVNFRLSDRELERLDFLCDRFTVDAANLFRLLLKKEADRFGFFYESIDDLEMRNEAKS